jgi:hypothetical protein
VNPKPHLTAEHREKISRSLREAHERGFTPRLPRGHGLSREAVAEWRAWHAEGYADAWSDTQRAAAIQLLGLIDAQRRLDIADAALRLRMARQIHSEREDLDLLRPSPAAERRKREARAEQTWREYLTSPSYAAMSDAELRGLGCPPHLIAGRQAPPELAA